MLAPKKVKYRKLMKGNMNGKAYRGAEISFGEYGMKAMTRAAKKGCKVWIRIFPDKPITKKPAETRMGKGKGNPEYWVAVVKPGRILYEVAGISEEVAKEAFKLASRKLPLAVRFMKREEVVS